MKNLNLREIEKNIEDAQKQFNVRGLALGIVRESGLAYVNGYGERNSKGDPVSGRTLFQIGSTTKAFTAFAIAALVDDGFLSWDSPVANLSDIEFEFNDPVVQTFANMLDLLSHRSGLPRHDLLFFIWPSLQNIYSKLRVLPPSPFQLRQKFHYNNICYNLAGDIAGSIFERHVKENGADFLTSAWARLVHNKILGPLEMLDTRTESAGMLNTANCAEGFRYDEEKERFVLYDVDSAYRVRGARPAGSMVSNIYDLAKWVSLMLRKGVLEDGKTRLLSKLNFEKLITPHMTYGKPVSDGPIQLESYGLGWTIDSYRGTPRIHHKGSTRGYTAHITTFPIHNLGFIVLCNTVDSQVPLLVSQILADACLFPDVSRDFWQKRFTDANIRTRLMEIELRKRVVTNRQMDTTPNHILPKYEGTFSNVVYGDFVLKTSSNKLGSICFKFEWNHLDGCQPFLFGSVGHWELDIFGVFEVMDYRDFNFPRYFLSFLDGGYNLFSISSSAKHYGVDSILFTRIF